MKNTFVFLIAFAAVFAVSFPLVANTPHTHYGTMADTVLIQQDTTISAVKDTTTRQIYLRVNTSKKISGYLD